MTSINAAALDRAIEELPRRFPGPGGAVAVVKDGQPIVRHGWGYANLETRQPFTGATLAPICSITKQFTCATMLSVSPDPDELDPLVSSLLPRLEARGPSTRHLANNQSGLRDYWALTVLCGAMPEGDFRSEDAARLIGLTRSLHFEPGSAYSYSNGNFRMLALALEMRTDLEFGDLVMKHAVGPAGMETAGFVPEASALPGGATGYEGTFGTGWRPGMNRLHWSGDAGLCASIDDMIAWERHIDRTRDDPASLYSRISVRTSFADGSPASYGYGLDRRTRWGRAMNGHAGAIRGWRLQRLWLPSERLSVDVTFNHESDSFAAAMHVIAAALGESDTLEPSNRKAAERFAGQWIDDRIGLLLDLATNPDGTLTATYDGGAEILSVGDDGIARGLYMTLIPHAGGVRIVRPGDAIDSLAQLVGKDRSQIICDIAGSYHSDELGSVLDIVDASGSWFAGFKGFLGSGPLMPMTPVGKDLWRLACHRSLDAPAPGDWTVRVRRSATGAIADLNVGCWLARDVEYCRTI
jgi:D-aminopeptidase